MMGLNQAQTSYDLKNRNVQRQQREVQRLGQQLNNVEKLKMLNYEGQLRYADQIADYNDNLQAAKYQVLGSIIGGMGSFYGGLGGMGMHKMGTQRDQPRDASINTGSLA